MRFLLDANICSEFIRGNRSVARLFRMHAHEVSISAITAAELYVWGMRTKSAAHWLTMIRDFVEAVPVVNIDTRIAELFGSTRASFLDQGRPLPVLDLLIATTAIVEQATLVTHNQRDFVDIPGLLLADWQETTP